MKRTISALVCLVALGATGCHKPMLSSAQAPDGGRYVVGQDGNDPAVWHCSMRFKECEKLDLYIEEGP